MLLIATKLMEVLARAGFTVAAMFVLPLQSAGHFGIAVTLIALFAFASGWERYIDLQRRLVGLPDHVFDRGVAAALRLYAFNWVVMLPIFWVCIGLAADLSVPLIAAASVIVISEQLASHLYALTVVQPRYFPAMATVAVKNSALALVVLGVTFFGEAPLTIEFVLTAWAIASAVGTIAMACAWLAVRRSGETDHPLARLPVFSQHRASLAHFGIGLLAVLSLQADRLIAGTLMPASTAGIYFRHVLIISFAYQAFNIISYNRLVPRVFAAAKTEPVRYLERTVRAEFVAILVLVLVGFAAALALNAVAGDLLARYHLNIAVGAILVLGAVLRVAADLEAMILNATMREGAIFRHQLVAVTIGGALLVPGALFYGIAGAATATVALSTTYLLLNSVAVRRGRQRTEPSSLNRPGPSAEPPSAAGPVAALHLGQIE